MHAVSLSEVKRAPKSSDIHRKVATLQAVCQKIITMQENYCLAERLCMDRNSPRRSFQDHLQSNLSLRAWTLHEQQRSRTMETPAMRPKQTQVAPLQIGSGRFRMLEWSSMCRSASPKILGRTKLCLPLYHLLERGYQQLLPCATLPSHLSSICHPDRCCRLHRPAETVRIASRPRRSVRPPNGEPRW